MRHGDPYKIGIGEANFVQQLWSFGWRTGHRTGVDRPKFRSAREGANRSSSYFSLDSCHSSESNLTKCNVRLINHQRVQIRRLVLKNQFWIKSAKHGLLCQISESPPKYFILENLGNPDSCLRLRVRHHQSCLGSGTWGRGGKVMKWAPPLARSKDRPLLNMICCFWKHMCSCLIIS